MEQKILSIDSQILNSIQSCPCKTDYQFNRHITSPIKAEPLEKGSLMHICLEIYYALIGSCAREGSETWQGLIEAGLTSKVPGLYLLPWEEKVKFAIEAGRFYATKMEIDTEVSTEILHQFSAYTSHYRYDSWRPLAVEEVGTKVIHESEELKILYNFKIDLVAEQGNLIAPFDHKTSSRRGSVSSLSNQFIGYCFGLGVNNIIVNKIGFQKTLSPQDRFQRFILTIDDARIDEWLDNTLFWCGKILECQETGQWPRNYTSCDKYSGCLYMPICEATPESREMKIERDYVIGQPWDVASVLEETKK